MTTINFNLVRLVFNFSNKFQQSCWLKRFRYIDAVFCNADSTKKTGSSVVSSSWPSELHNVLLIFLGIYHLEFYFGTYVYTFILKCMEIPGIWKRGGWKSRRFMLVFHYIFFWKWLPLMFHLSYQNSGTILSIEKPRGRRR